MCLFSICNSRIMIFKILGWNPYLMLKKEIHTHTYTHTPEQAIHPTGISIEFHIQVPYTDLLWERHVSSRASHLHRERCCV